MINTSPIDFASIDEVVNNFDFYKEIFLKDGIIVFRNANLSVQQQSYLHNILKEKFNCWVDERKYVENHSKSTRLPTSGPDEIMLDWHVEHPYYEVPIVFATWNMYKFNTDTNNGKTYFVDMELLFNMLSDEDKNFLLGCVEKNYLPIENSNVRNEHTTIGMHWITNRPVIRTAFVIDSIANVQLKTLNGKEPTASEIQKYENIILSIRNTIRNNTDIRIVHKWQQGDLLIPDMYKMCHAVTGGFSPDDREFSGMWGYFDRNKN